MHGTFHTKLDANYLYSAKRERWRDVTGGEQNIRSKENSCLCHGRFVCNFPLQTEQQLGHD